LMEAIPRMSGTSHRSITTPQINSLCTVFIARYSGLELFG
jgi:hypothetical protein